MSTPDWTGLNDEWWQHKINPLNAYPHLCLSSFFTKTEKGPTVGRQEGTSCHVICSVVKERNFITKNSISSLYYTRWTTLQKISTRWSSWLHRNVFTASLAEKKNQFQPPWSELLRSWCGVGGGRLCWMQHCCVQKVTMSCKIFQVELGQQLQPHVPWP